MLFQELKYPPWVGLQSDYLMPISVPGIGISLPLIGQGARGTPERVGIILSLLLVAHHNQMIRWYLLKTPPIAGHREINLTD